MKVKLKFPMGPKDVLTYVGYLLKVRKVQGSTVEKYLVGLRYENKIYVETIII